MNEKYRAVKVSRSLEKTLSVIAVRQLIIQFSMENQYPKHVYHIETFSAKKIDLFLSNLKDAWEAAVFPATAQVNTGNQPLATVATKKPHFGEIVATLILQLVYGRVVNDRFECVQ